MKKNLIYLLWTSINVLWWDVAMFSASWYNHDVNPVLGDLEEFILNIAVWLAGLLIILIFCKEEKEIQEEEVK